MKSDTFRGLSVSVALNMKQVIEMGRLAGLKSFVNNRDNHPLSSLFNFFSQCRNLRTVVMRENPGASDTAQAVECSMSWR